MGNNNYNWDPKLYLTGSRNAGITLGVSVPLDGGAVELCKERARTEIARQQAEADKASDSILSWFGLLKCGEAMRSGVRFHPNSPYSICADVVVVNPQHHQHQQLPVNGDDNG